MSSCQGEALLLWLFQALCNISLNEEGCALPLGVGHTEAQSQQTSHVAWRQTMTSQSGGKLGLCEGLGIGQRMSEAAWLIKRNPLYCHLLVYQRPEDGHVYGGLDFRGQSHGGDMWHISRNVWNRPSKHIHLCSLLLRGHREIVSEWPPPGGGARGRIWYSRSGALMERLAWASPFWQINPRPYMPLFYGEISSSWG